MRRFPIRWGLFAAAVLTFSVGTVAVFPTPSYAAVPSITTMGGPVNVLPSAVEAASGATSSLSKADMMAIYMYRASKSPEFWALYAQAQQKAATTGKALELTSDVAAEAQTIYPTASKVAPYVKTVGKAAGTAGAVITAYEVGSKVTNGTLDLVGIDATGTVCSSTGRDLWGLIVQGAAGADCSGYDQKIAASFTPNADAKGGLGSQAVCDPSGKGGCASVSGAYDYSSTRQTYCITVRGGTDFPKSDNDSWSYGILYSQLKEPTQVYATSGWAYSNSNKPSWMACTIPAGARALGIDTNKDNGLAGIGFTEDKMVDVRETSADPERTLKCTIAGTDGKQYVEHSAPFRESGGILPDPKCAPLPDGVVPETTTITETGGDEGEDPIWSTKTSDAVRNALVNTGCGTSTGTQCQLQLYKDGKSCFAGADCQGWFQDPDKSRYRCEYGNKTVDLSECTTYAPRWEPDQQQKGDTLGDPKTGEPLKNPKPALSPGSTAAAGSTSADGATSLGANNCFKNMAVTLNPLSWVVEPFKCMFIARDGYTESILKTYQKKADNTFPAKLAAQVGSLSFKGPGSGCTGIPVHIGEAIPDFTIMAACPGDMLAPAAMWGRIFLDLGISVVGLLAITKFVGSAFGFTGLGSKGDDE